MHHTQRKHTITHRRQLKRNANHWQSLDCFCASHTNAKLTITHRRQLKRNANHWQGIAITGLLLCITHKCSASHTSPPTPISGNEGSIGSITYGRLSLVRASRRPQQSNHCACFLKQFTTCSGQANPKASKCIRWNTGWDVSRQNVCLDTMA